MSSRSAPASARPGARSRPSNKATPRRRRRSRSAAARRRLLALVTAGLAVGLVVAVAPMLRHAVRELTLPLQHEDIIRQQASEKHLDPSLIAAVIYAETKFVPRTSSAGAQGLMQLLPSTALFLAKRTDGTAFVPTDLSSPDINIRYGSYYLRFLLDHYGGHVIPAIAAYNAGLTNVDRWLGPGGKLAVASIPFAETRAYVTRVLDARGRYRKQYAHELGLR